jgi:hypothetical protein
VYRSTCTRTDVDTSMTMIKYSGGQTFFTTDRKKNVFLIIFFFFFYVNVKYYIYANKCCNLEYFRGLDIK